MERWTPFWFIPEKSSNVPSQQMPRRLFWPITTQAALYRIQFYAAWFAIRPFFSRGGQLSDAA